MYLKFLFCFVLAFYCCKKISAQPPSWLWAKATTGTSIGSDYPNNIAVDKNGNSFIAGTTISTANNADLFIAKYNATGNQLWIRKASWLSDEVVAGVSVDSVGNCYVTGHFSGSTINFDGGVTLTNNSGSSVAMFIVKYNTFGSIVWARTSAGYGSAVPRDIATDPAGNSYVTGYCTNQPLIFDTISLSGSIYNDLFVVKYDVAGNVVWARRHAVGNKKAEGQRIATDIHGNCYIAGEHASWLDFGTDTLYSWHPTSNAFMVKYNKSGTKLWAKNVCTVGDIMVGDIAADDNGSCYLTGRTNAQHITFDSSWSSIGPNVFIIKYDTAGQLFWAKAAAMTYAKSVILAGLAVDGKGNSFITGSYADSSVTFDTATLTHTAGYDMFVLRYDTAGMLQWALNNGCNDYNESVAIGIDAQGNSYILGYFYSPSLSFGSHTIYNSTSYYKPFVAKVSPGLPVVNGLGALSSISRVQIFPVPANDVLFIETQTSPIGKICVYDLQGRKLLEQYCEHSRGSIETGSLSKGVYLIQFAGMTKRFMKE